MARRRKRRGLGDSSAEHASQAAYELREASRKRLDAMRRMRKGDCEGAVDHMVGAQSHRGSAESSILAMSSGSRRKNLQSSLDGLDRSLFNQRERIWASCVRQTPRRSR